MLEWIATPYGEMVPKFNGNLLASKVDPLKEARAWVSHHRMQIESAKNHILLGVGSGHHVLELSRQFPESEFICIEYLENLSISHIYVQIRTLPNVELIVGDDEKKILRNERLQKILGDTFTVLSHLNSYKVSEKFYDKTKSTLVGRDWKAFNQVLKFRSEDEMFLNEMNFEPKTQTSISAKEIVEFVGKRQSIEDQTNLSDSEIIWLTLGELIK